MFTKSAKVSVVTTKQRLPDKPLSASLSSDLMRPSCGRASALVEMSGFVYKRDEGTYAEKHKGPD